MGLRLKDSSDELLINSKIVHRRIQFEKWGWFMSSAVREPITGSGGFHVGSKPPTGFRSSGQGAKGEADPCGILEFVVLWLFIRYRSCILHFCIFHSRIFSDPSPHPCLGLTGVAHFMHKRL